MRQEKMDKFIEELKKFFKDARHFLSETVEGYSMSGEDDNERDALVNTIARLENQIQKMPIDDELYDDNIVPGMPEEEYLAPTKDEGGIMEETYEEPTGSGRNDKKKAEEEDGIMEDTYEDPYADGRRKPVPSKPEEKNEEEGIMEDMYEDPYADGKRKVPPPSPKQKEGKDKDKDKRKKKETKKGKDNKDDSTSNRSDESNEDAIPPVSAPDMKDCEMKGFLKKQRGKSHSILFDSNVWCAIKDKIFYYFDKKTSKKQKAAFLLNDYVASPLKEEVEKKKYVFQLACPGRTTYYFSSQKEEELKQWVSYINTGKLQVESPPISAPPSVSEEDGELYEGEEPPPRTGAENEDEGEYNPDELYEDTEDYVRKPADAIQEVAEGDDVYDDTIAEAPTLPQRPKANQPPPPTPARDLPPLPPPTSGESQDIYDDTTVATVIVEGGEGDEVYDDGTSVPSRPPEMRKNTPPELPKPRTADLSRVKTEHMPPEPPQQRKSAAPVPDELPPPPEVNYENMYYGLWGCSNVTENELEFSSGDCIEILNKDRYGGAGWWVGKLGAKVGLVPKEYLSPMYKAI